FRKTAAYGHFGREDADFTWEKTPLIEKLKDHARSEASTNGHANGKSAKKPAKAKTAAKTTSAARA
ncbi:MAG TPA: hypothetical protein VFT22_05850, partial [Kofleriaceae bacterium]|nr:hypothetical protein [Kofleriaceae bacterium]